MFCHHWCGYSLEGPWLQLVSLWYTYIYIYIFICVCVCVICICKWLGDWVGFIDNMNTRWSTWTIDNNNGPLAEQRGIAEHYIGLIHGRSYSYISHWRMTEVRAVTAVPGRASIYRPIVRIHPVPLYSTIWLASHRQARDKEAMHHGNFTVSNKKFSYYLHLRRYTR